MIQNINKTKIIHFAQYKNELTDIVSTVGEAKHNKDSSKNFHYMGFRELDTYYEIGVDMLNVLPLKDFEDFDVILKFENIKSVDMLIKQLKLLKKDMRK